MKKSKNHKNVKVIIIVAVCLAFVVGIGAGVGAGRYFLDKKGQKTDAKTENAKPDHTSQNGSDVVKGEADSKDDGENADANSSKGESSKGDNSKDKADSTDPNQNDGKANEQNQGTDNQGQAAVTSTYDTSVPADDKAVHRYEYIISDATWQEAFQDCLNRGGYLVRINSSDEYEAIRKEISRQKMTDIYFRIGGRRDSQSKDYYWVNEENKLFGEKLNSDSSWCSEEWMKGEPSFQDGNLEEKYMDLFFFDGEKRFVWNDVPDDMLKAEPAYSGKLGYICEYEN